MIIRQHGRTHLADPTDTEWLMCNVLVLSGVEVDDSTEVDCRGCLRRQESVRWRKLREENR